MWERIRTDERILRLEPSLVESIRDTPRGTKGAFTLDNLRVTP